MVTVIFIVTSLVMWCPSLFAKISRPQGGIPLSLFLALSLYVAIPFGHWVWMNGGFNNTTVLVSRNHSTLQCFARVYRIWPQPKLTE